MLPPTSPLPPPRASLAPPLERCATRPTESRVPPRHALTTPLFPLPLRLLLLLLTTAAHARSMAVLGMRSLQGTGAQVLKTVCSRSAKLCALTQEAPQHEQELPPDDRCATRRGAGMGARWRAKGRR